MIWQKVQSWLGIRPPILALTLVNQEVRYVVRQGARMLTQGSCSVPQAFKDGRLAEPEALARVLLPLVFSRASSTARRWISSMSPTSTLVCSGEAAAQCSAVGASSPTNTGARSSSRPSSTARARTVSASPIRKVGACGSSTWRQLPSSRKASPMTSDTFPLSPRFTPSAVVYLSIPFGSVDEVAAPVAPSFFLVGRSLRLATRANVSMWTN